jgi:hypothetical protein
VDRKIRFALVGCGRTANNHFDAIKQHAARCELTDVCDVDPAALAAAVEKTGARGHARLATLLSRSKADCILLTSPSGQNPAQTLARMTLARTQLPRFAEIEVRERSLFVTLTYPDDIHPGDMACILGKRIENFGQQVAFVAIKNGMHCARGFAFVLPNTPAQISASPVHVAALFDMTLQATT